MSQPFYVSQASTVLSRFEANLFVRPYASKGKNADGVFGYARPMAKDDAIDYAYINANGPRALHYLPFDIDRSIDLDDFTDRKIPQPNIVVRDRFTGKAHILYELEKPIYKNKRTDTRPGEASPVRYYNRVREELKKTLDADIAYHGSLVKNPLNSERWDVSVLTDYRYSLGELADYCDMTSPRRAYKPAGELVPLAEAYEGCRQHTLFEHLRRSAYLEKQYHQTEESFARAVKDQAETMNDQIPSPLELSLVYSTAKAVSRWTWKHYQQDNRRRGIMNLDKKLPIHVRQQMGQEFSAGVKLENTDNLLRATIIELHNKGVRLTKANVAKSANLSRTTVYAHWNNAIASLPSEIKVSPLPSKLTSNLKPAASASPLYTEMNTSLCSFSVEGLSKRDNEILREAVPSIAKSTGYGRAPLPDLIIAMQIQRKKKMRETTISKITASRFYRDGAVYMTETKNEREAISKPTKTESLEITEPSIFREIPDDKILIHGVFLVDKPKPEQPTGVDRERQSKFDQAMARMRARLGI